MFERSVDPELPLGKGERERERKEQLHEFASLREFAAGYTHRITSRPGWKRSLTIHRWNLSLLDDGEIFAFYAQGDSFPRARVISRPCVRVFFYSPAR